MIDAYASAYGWGRDAVLYDTPWLELKALDRFIAYRQWQGRLWETQIQGAEYDEPAPLMPWEKRDQPKRTPVGITRERKALQSLRDLQSQPWV